MKRFQKWLAVLCALALLATGITAFAEGEEQAPAGTVTVGGTWNGEVSPDAETVVLLSVQHAAKIHLIAEGDGLRAAVRKAYDPDGTGNIASGAAEGGSLHLSWSAEEEDYLLSFRGNSGAFGVWVLNNKAYEEVVEAQKAAEEEAARQAEEEAQKAAEEEAARQAEEEAQKAAEEEAARQAEEEAKKAAEEEAARQAEEEAQKAAEEEAARQAEEEARKAAEEEARKAEEEQQKADDEEKEPEQEPEKQPEDKTDEEPESEPEVTDPEPTESEPEEAEQDPGEEEPAEGEEPAENEEPAEDEEPVEGEEPTEGEEPAEDKEPAEGEEPAEDEEPAEGEEPIESEEPAEGKEPAENEEPAEGEEPAENEEPAEDKEPTEGEEPVEGEEPEDEKEPEEEIEPIEGEEETKVGEDEQPEQPELPETEQPEAPQPEEGNEEGEEEGQPSGGVEITIAKTLRMGESWDGIVKRKAPTILKLDLDNPQKVYIVLEGKNLWTTVEKSDRREENPPKQMTEADSNRTVLIREAESGSWLVSIGTNEDSLMAKAKVSFMTEEAYRAWEAENIPAEEEEMLPDEEQIADEEENIPESITERSIDVNVTWDTDDPAIGDTAHFHAALTGYEDLTYSMQWQYSADHKKWTDLAGETMEDMDVVVTEENNVVYWRIVVYVEEDQEG